MAETEWEPKIVAFCCNWCSYGGADTAGVGRVPPPPLFPEDHQGDVFRTY
ncbi:methyl-viologen-reducing hydrogenase delta subunit [Methanolobus psychrophilus R15]|nr:methyl-viologen-reducing hydrogenase delta subunit [Methanolobus psychrophilus R15]